MKPIKNCKWEVGIVADPEFIPTSNKRDKWRLVHFYRWQARIVGAGIKTLIYSNKDDYKTFKAAKKNWEKFVKVNKIKNWRCTNDNEK